MAASSLMSRLLEGWARRAARRPRTVLGLLAGLVLAAVVATALSLEVTSDTDAMLAADLPFEQRIRQIEAEFPDLSHNLAVGITADTPETAMAAAEALARTLEGSPGVAAVFAPEIDPVQRAHWPLYRDRAALQADLRRLAGAADLIARLRAVPEVPEFLSALSELTDSAAQAPGGLASIDPFLAETAAVWKAAHVGELRALSWQRALAGGADSGSIWLSVTPRLNLSLLSPADPALAAIAASRAAMPEDLAQAVEVVVTGEAAMRAEEMDSVITGLGLSFGVSLILVAVILWFGQGGGRAGAGRAVLTLAVMLAALVLTTGFAALALEPLNLISVAFIVLMVGLGVDFPIHFLAHLRAERGQEAHGGAQAVARRHGPSLALAAVTTAAGFMAFGATDFIGLAQLGVIGGAGVLIAFGVTMTALPAAASLWPGLKAPSGQAPALETRLSRRGLLLRGGLGAALALTALVLASDARFDADPLNLRPADAPAARAFARLAQAPETSPYRLHVLVDDAEAAAQRADALNALPEVAGTRWLGTFVPQDQAAKLAMVRQVATMLTQARRGTSQAVDRAALAAALRATGAGPGAGALATELARGDPPGLEKALFRHFQALLDRLDALDGLGPLTEADLPAPLRDSFVTTDGRLRLAILPRDDLRDPAAMRRFTEAVHQEAPTAGGPPDEITGAEATVAGALITAAGLAMTATVILVGLALRSALATAAVLVPIMAAAAVTAAGSVLLGMPFNYANMIVLPLLFGFGADTCIYLARAASQNPQATFRSATPRAVTVSAATTAAAFGALALSDHPGTASMGAMLVLALAAVVAMAFTLTPAILALTTRPDDPDVDRR